MTEPTDNVSRLARIAKTMEAGHWPSSAKIVREAADEIEQLRAELVSTTNKLTAERDEARREVCGLDADIMEDQVEYAKHRGWDCFEKDGNA